MKNLPEKIDYFQIEIDQSRKEFDIELMLSFQMKNDIQITRGLDYQYICWINGKSYAISLTFMDALTTGVNQYLKQQQQNHE